MAYEIIDLEPNTVGTEGVTVDHIIWRRYRRPMWGLVEILLDQPENAHLEHQLPYLAVGTVVYVPVVATDDFETIPVVSLWD